MLGYFKLNVTFIPWLLQVRMLKFKENKHFLWDLEPKCLASHPRVLPSTTKLGTRSEMSSDLELCLSWVVQMTERKRINYFSAVYDDDDDNNNNNNN